MTYDPRFEPGHPQLPGQALQDPSAVPGLDDNPANDRFGPYKTLARILRARLKWVLVLGIGGVLAGAAAGFLSQKPTYLSEGLIQVEYTLPMVLVQTDQNQHIGMFEEFIQSQVLIMKSRHLHERAIKRPEWTDVVGKDNDFPADLFGMLLTVENPPRSQNIKIDFKAGNPQMAAAGVRSLTAAFLEQASTSGGSTNAARLQILRQRKDQLDRAIQEVLRKMVAEARRPTPQQIAAVDELMLDYLKQLGQQESALARLRAQGLGDAHPSIDNTLHQVELLKQRIEAYTDEFLESQIALAASANQEGQKLSILPSFQKYHGELSKLSKERDDIIGRMQGLTIEAELGASRFRVIANGDIPDAPYKDRRRIFALLGAGFGGLVPLAFILLLGLLDRRCRFSDDAKELAPNLDFLGILPELPAWNDDPTLQGIATHCVHQLRIRLQLLGTGKRRVYMVTSSAPGEGKSSLTLALGLSFAATGARTLLIDCDTVGRGLSSRLDSTRVPGVLETHEGHELSYARAVAENLWLLPIGQDAEQAAGKLSQRFVEKLVERARKEFDYVLIDTGPVLGGLEVPVVARSVDNVLFTISNGQQHSLVKKALGALKSINARVGGFVFNRAVASEYRKMLEGSSVNYFTGGAAALAPAGAAAIAGPADSRIGGLLLSDGKNGN